VSHDDGGDVGAGGRLTGVDRPRALPVGFRARLEAALRDGTGSEAAGVALAGADRPRPLPPGVRRAVTAALETTVPTVVPSGPRRWAVLTAAAAAAVVLVVVSALVVVGTGGEDGRAGGRPVETAVSPGPGGAPGGEPSDVVAQAGGNPVGLVSFSACSELLGYLQREATDRVGPWGVAGIDDSGATFTGDARLVTRGGDQLGLQSIDQRSPGTVMGTAGASNDVPGPSGAFSASNVQEAGVDEPDIVKTDGEAIYAVSPSGVKIVDAAVVPPAVLAVIPSGSPDPSAARLLLDGERLTILSSLHGPSTDADGPQGPHVVVRVYDVSDPAEPVKSGEATLDGALVSARLAGGLVRVVTRTGPDLAFLGPLDETPEAKEMASAYNREVIANSTIEQWIGDRPCERVAHPVEFSGFALLSVHTVDPADPTGDEEVAVLAGGGTVYASKENLYVASQPFETWQVATDAGGNPVTPPDPRTDVHRFAIDDGPARYLASGSVPGYLLNQFSLSEYEGHLRVATTEGTPFAAPDQPSQSGVSVLGTEGDVLVTVGRVDGLGPTEQIYGVRFVGPLGYVVTFRRTDPLYVLDLADPADPRRRGELHVTGYSAYLHPLGGDLLLGLGQEADEAGRVQGLQVSLFDVGDLDAPALVDRLIEPMMFTPAETDHLAFLYWAPRDLAVVPVEGPGLVGALVVRVAGDGVEEVARIAAPLGEYGGVGYVQRALVVGDRLYTVSNLGVAATGLDAFDDQGFVSFSGP